MARATEPLAEVSGLFDHPSKGKLRGGIALGGTGFSEGTPQAARQEQPMQDSGVLGYGEAVGQPVGTEAEPTSLRRGPVREQEKASGKPGGATAGVTPTCPDAGRGVVVVRAGETPAHGEGPQETGRDGSLGDDTPTEVRRISVPEMQKRLAEKAVGDPAHRFGGLYDLLSQESVLDEAATRLLGNKGSRTPGLDGVTRRMLRDNREHHLRLLQRQLRDGTFKPMPVLRIYIPKPNGKQRPLGIPTLYGRWVQMAIKIVIEPIFESDFAAFSHGFRPGRSRLTASGHIHRLTIQPRRKVYWVIEGDIEGCFDHVHHKRLMTLLRQRIGDKELLNLIWAFLRAGVMEGQLFTKTTEGTPQGGILSPLLANIYLNRFDQWFTERAMLGKPSSRRERNRKAGHANFMVVRYADDFVIFSNGTKEETEAFKAEVTSWMGEDLKLTLSAEKTAITHYADGFDFLGYTFKKTMDRTGKREVVVSYPSTESVQRAVRRIEDLTDRTTLMNSHEDQIEALNSFLRGWGEYFRHSSAKKALRYVGAHAFMRMWKWLNQKDEHRHGWRTTKERYYRDYSWQVGQHRLVRLQQMKVEYPRHRAIPHPYLTPAPVTEPRHYDPFRADWTGNQELGADWTPNRDRAWNASQGTCVICGEPAYDVHHVKARRKGGGNAVENQRPLCRKHHREAERRNSPTSHQLRETPPVSGEPDAPKGARPVRGAML